MQKCLHCGKEYDLSKLNSRKYCIECKKCNKLECKEGPFVVKEFKLKDEKGAFVKCKCGEKVYEQYSVYKCPHCKKEIKDKLDIIFWPIIIK